MWVKTDGPALPSRSRRLPRYGHVGRVWSALPDREARIRLRVLPHASARIPASLVWLVLEHRPVKGFSEIIGTVKLWGRKDEPASPGMRRFESRGGEVSFELPAHWSESKDGDGKHFFDPANREAFLMMGVQRVRGPAPIDPAAMLAKLLDKTPGAELQTFSPDFSALKRVVGPSAGGGVHVLLQYVKATPRGGTLVTVSHFEMTPDIAEMVERQLRGMTFR